MTEPIHDSHEELRQWVARWKRVGPELEAIREREIREADTVKAVRDLFGDEELTCLPPPRLSSGLVEQQAWFAKLRP